jgi:predicted RND superfamily exporter protein
MSSYESAVLKHFGYAAHTASRSTSPACATAVLCPAFSLPDLFAGGEAPGGKLSRTEIAGVLGAIPPYFSRSVISADHKSATLAFGIRLMPLQRQQRVVETMRSMLHAPAGIHAQLVGLAVLAAQADSRVASAGARTLALLVSLLIVGAVLLAVFRGSFRRTLAAFAPVALASGWSGLLLVVSRVPLNPMSATLSILVVAVATEISVLVSERFRQELGAGRDRESALRVTYERTGAAVAASLITAIAGFGVLALSEVQMLRDFGLVTILDLGVALLGVLLVLPSVLMLLTREGLRDPSMVAARSAPRSPRAPVAERIGA